VLSGSIETLVKWLQNGNLNDDARKALLNALEQARANRELLRDILGKLDPSVLSDDQYAKLKEEAQQE
jgi:hypothetical protein